MEDRPYKALQALRDNDLDRVDIKAIEDYIEGLESDAYNARNREDSYPV